MSRIRTVKPEFWTSEQVISCSPLARLLFIGLWNFCDDNGIHPASYVRLKAELFPADSCPIEEIKHWVSDLIQNELLREYVVDDKTYWIVTGWKKHQRIDKPTYRHPVPQSNLKKIADCSTSNSGALDDHSQTTSRFIPDSSTTEWKGIERNVKDKDIWEVKTSLCVIPSDIRTSVNEVFSHWQIVLNHPRAKLDKKRENRIARALKLGYSVNDLKQAVNGCAKTPFNVGQNERGQRYDDIELILRDAAHIDRFIDNAINPPVANAKSTGTATNLMAGVI